jgi:small ligand-binding sensory domain FIST
MKAGVGYSGELSAESAARGAVGQARENLCGSLPASALVFATAAWGPGLPDLLSAVRRELGGCEVFGASVAGLFAAGAGTAENPGLAVALLADLEVEAALLEDLAADEPESGAEILDHFRRPPAAPDLLLLMLDLQHTSPTPLLRSLGQHLETSLVVGLGASPPSGRDALMWRDDRLVSGATLALVLRGAGPAHWGVAQGWRALSGSHLVTRSRDRWISSLDGQPALEVLRGVAGRAGLSASDESLGQIMLAVDHTENGETEAAAGSLLRSVVGTDPRRKAILLPDDFQPGTRLRFVVRDAVAARENLEVLVTEQVKPGSGLGLYVSGSTLDYAGARGTARDARCFASHDANFPVLGLRGSQLLGPAGSVGSQCTVLNDCGLLTVLEG